MSGIVHALVLRLDAAGEARIERLWDRLAASGLAVRPRSTGAPPHVSLGVSDTLNIETLSHELRKSHSLSATPALHFSSVGVFPTSEGVVFLAPVVTEELLAFHREVYPLFLTAATGPRAYYAPKAWVPHCTIDYGLGPSEVTRTVTECCAAVDSPFEASTVGLSALKGTPDVVEVLASWP